MGMQFYFNKTAFRRLAKLFIIKIKKILSNYFTKSYLDYLLKFNHNGVRVLRAHSVRHLHDGRRGRNRGRHLHSRLLRNRRVWDLPLVQDRQTHMLP